MLPRLQAEETLDAVTAFALGTGNLKPQDARRVHAGLLSRANVRAAAPADPRALSMMGIKVEMVGAPPQGQADD